MVQAGRQPLRRFTRLRCTHSVWFEYKAWRVGWEQIVGSMKAVELG